MLRAIAAFSLLVALTLSVSVPGSYAQPPGGGDWEVIPQLTDEFEGGTLDSTKWYDHNPTWIGRKPALFSKANVFVEGGQLHLEARSGSPDNAPDGYHSFTTAAVKSRNRALYGYFEVRCRPMNSRASSAFWFYAQDPDKEETEWWTEIDVFEICGNCPERDHVYHMNAHVFVTPEDGENHWMDADTWSAPYRLADGFHVYALEWNEAVIRWYVDGNVVRELDNTHWHQPLHLTFDSETFQDWFGLPHEDELPATFSIDYIRSWKEANGDP